LQDGIKLMRKGEIVTCLFPSHKAFGYGGSEGINPNEPLIYTVHLKEIIVKN
jgi:FKBP-type peptidyl-prolyl cis-trans isomerase